MREEIQSFIKTLHHKNALTSSLERDVFNISNNMLSPGVFIDKVVREAKEEDCLRCGGKSFCHFFLAFAHLELNAVYQAKSLLEEAIKGFDVQGLKWNQAMCYELLGTILLQEGNNDAAQRTLQKALEILLVVLSELRTEDKYKHASQCKKHIAGIQKKLKDISNNAARGAAPAGNPPPPAMPIRKHKASTATEDFTDYFTLPWLPIYQDVRAGANGVIELVEESKNRHPKTDIIWLDDLECTIHSLRKKSRRDHQVTLTKEAEGWGWARVQGQSMNQCKTFPILDGDYVLFRKQSTAQDMDIVIVSKPKTKAEEYPYMVKRYNADGEYLSSETSKKGDEYRPIRLNKDFQILGVACAVARPKRTRSTEVTFEEPPTAAPLSPKEQELYRTLLSMVGRDAGVAERLIEYERKHTPNASREDLLKNAIEKLMRDRDVPLRDRHVP